jgi:surface antigen
MAGPVACPASRLTSYSGTRPARHWRPLAPLGAVIVLSLAASGCAMSGHLGNLFGSAGDADAQAVTRAEATGSIGQGARDGRNALASAPPDADLASAKAAAADVLARGGKDMSAPWENPRTGARGTVTPIAVAYTHEGMTCRDFLASHVTGAGSQAWLQGEACKGSKGQWEVRTLKPWKRS